ncbi:metabolite traffic protein EboE [Chitinophagaceae bacterium LB-8]|uniref:Metabolite traffic protein EboE n=1 Tax=Paraflavisolibacter caeni TaxID=2982496 RepID=A0A9X3BIE7_9BACT|nr:metabolite traffic protein EboE [Paraflavisolibacter caeni]MCU7549938.1 metabolite traffic protein EboE [Paraflavisolibacter caeni]
MKTPYGHLTYCSNIHAGESWKDHFAQLKKYIPHIKQEASPHQPFGIGLRLSNIASLELEWEENMEAFKQWLQQEDCYVFTMNGFPYGSFHHTRVKDQVHAPDWTNYDRFQYTLRMAWLLAELLPEGMDGGISTSPLSYQFWHEPEQMDEVFVKATKHILGVVEELIQIKDVTGKMIHLDIEPEPDGLLGESEAFFEWYTQYLLPMGIDYLHDQFGYGETQAVAAIKEHVQLCYDICHFAVCYEDHAAVLEKLRKLGIKTGKIQISAALKGAFCQDLQMRGAVVDAFEDINESTYLHQVVAMQKDGSLIRYPDIPIALKDAANEFTTEWRAHFHVPLFVDHYGVLGSTQKDIEQVLQLHQQQPFTTHLEIETYTWEVLPGDMRLPIEDSIVRELEWVQGLLKRKSTSAATNQAASNQTYHA